MAKHFSEVKRELEQPDGHMAGIGQQLKLSEEARDARNAGRRLEDENDETDLIGTVKKLEDLIAEQRRSNERIAREMRGMVSEMKDVLEKVEELRNGAADAQHQANQMFRMGHRVVVYGLIGDRPIVGVGLLLAIGTAFLGILRLCGFGRGACTGLVADAIIGTAADERDEGKAADGGDDLPVMRLLLAFRVCQHVVPVRRRFGGIPVVHLDIVLFIVLHGCIPLSN